MISYSNSPPYNVATTASYTCDTGYGLSGEGTRTCQEGDRTSANGVWSGTAPPTCVAITCTSLSPVDNAVITYSPDTTSPFDLETSALHSCVDGFFLSGSSTRRCEGDGSSTSGMWSGSAPICTGITNLDTSIHSNMIWSVFADVMCPTLTDPQNGAITLSVDNAGTSTAMYSCNTGYALTGGDTVRTCTGVVIEGQEWTGTAPSCEGIIIIYSTDLVHHVSLCTCSYHVFLPSSAW